MTERRVQDGTGTDAQMMEQWRQRALEAERLMALHPEHTPEWCPYCRMDEAERTVREQRDRTSFWETLHDERVESLETERDKALRMRDYWYAEFKRTVDPVNNPHRCSSECADNPTCPAIRAYDQDATDG